MTNFIEPEDTPSGKQYSIFSSNLFKISIVRSIFNSPLYPLVLQIGSGLVFIAIIAYGFLGPPHGGDNFSITVTWMLWWLILPFSFILVGRLWCGVCPLGAASDAIRKVFTYKRRQPGVFLRKGGVWIISLSFLAFAWAGMIWHFDDNPILTAIILLALLLAVIIVSLVYSRRTWCRFLCPLGMVAAMYSMLSLIGLRANRRICKEECSSTKCYAVGESNDGCAMFEFPAAITSSRNCNFCSECIKNCKEQSMHLHIRRPFSELWHRWQPSTGDTFFVMVLMGLIFFEVLRMTELYPDFMMEFMQTGIIANYNVALSLTLLALMAIIFIFYGLRSSLSQRLIRRTGEGNSTGYAYAYIPIALAGHLGASIQHLVQHGPRAAKVTINQLALSNPVFDLPAMAKGASYEIDVPLKTIQLLIIAVAVVGSLYACWKIAQRDGNPPELRIVLPHMAFVGILSVSLFLLFLLPMGLLH